jgi:hypothetical protein
VCQFVLMLGILILIAASCELAIAALQIGHAQLQCIVQDIVVSVCVCVCVCMCGCVCVCVCVWCVCVCDVCVWCVCVWCVCVCVWCGANKNRKWVFSYLIYLLTAIGLSPGGSTHLHTNNT